MSRNLINRLIDHWTEQLKEAADVADILACVEMLEYLYSKEGK